METFTKEEAIEIVKKFLKDHYRTKVLDDWTLEVLLENIEYYFNND